MSLHDHLSGITQPRRRDEIQIATISWEQRSIFDDLLRSQQYLPARL
jgi:hypothetical protein